MLPTDSPVSTIPISTPRPDIACFNCRFEVDHILNIGHLGLKSLRYADLGGFDFGIPVCNRNVIPTGTEHASVFAHFVFYTGVRYCC